MSKIKGWQAISKSKQFSGNKMFEAYSNNEKVHIALWSDWEHFWNVYVSFYPFRLDKEVYRGKKKDVAYKKMISYMKRFSKTNPSALKKSLKKKR